MGCDIHIVLERKIGDCWIGIDTFKTHETIHGVLGSPTAVSRNYERFAALAGVMGTGPAPRGMPVNASETATILCEDWGGDSHSHSWLLADEAAAIFLTTQREPNDYCRQFPASFFFGVEHDPKDYRIVFWFDSCLSG